MRYYISDLHFWHRRLNQNMDQRGFETVEEMNEYMISQWNSRVRKNDEVAKEAVQAIVEITDRMVAEMKQKKVKGESDNEGK